MLLLNAKICMLFQLLIHIMYFSLISYLLCWDGLNPLNFFIFIYMLELREK